MNTIALKPRFYCWLAAAVLGAAGCAAAYHAYPCGQVPYAYRPEPPLPYVSYCACPTPIAAEFGEKAGSDIMAASHPLAPAPPSELF